MSSDHVLSTECPPETPPDAIFQTFEHKHLPPHLQTFGELAQRIVVTLPRNAERTVALRKLLESKDCAVRSLLSKTTP